MSVSDTWPIGLSWTKGYLAETENPDGTKEKVYVHGGPFYFSPKGFGILRFFFLYAGFRPTPTWSAGYGDEGIFGSIGRWLKRNDMGNLGIAIRND